MVQGEVENEGGGCVWKSRFATVERGVWGRTNLKTCPKLCLFPPYLEDPLTKQTRDIEDMTNGHLIEY